MLAKVCDWSQVHSLFHGFLPGDGSPHLLRPVATKAGAYSACAHSEPLSQTSAAVANSRSYPEANPACSGSLTNFSTVLTQRTACPSEEILLASHQARRSHTLIYAEIQREENETSRHRACSHCYDGAAVISFTALRGDIFREGMPVAWSSRS